MRQGITTRYLGPTNSKGSRIKAVARKRDSWGPEQGLTDHLDHALNSEQNHTRVAHLLAAKLGWSGLWVGGGNAEGTGFHYVNTGLPEPISETAPGKYVHGIGVEGTDWFFVPFPPVS